jgi:hypothetical protein
MHDLANDVALAIRSSSKGPVVLIGHAFGNLLARMVTTDHPALVKAMSLAAAQASRTPRTSERHPSMPATHPRLRLSDSAALRKAFFARNHDANIWFRGWYPETLKMQHAALKAVPASDYWASGNVPLLEIIPACDPFKPKAYWQEPHNQFPDRVIIEQHKNRIQSAGLNILAPMKPAQKYLGDTVFEALWAELNLRQAVVFVDPCPATSSAGWRRVQRGTSGKRVELEAIRQRKSGVRFDVSVVAGGISLGFDQVAAVYLIYRDITKRKNAERKLERS